VYRTGLFRGGQNHRTVYDTRRGSGAVQGFKLRFTDLYNAGFPSYTIGITQDFLLIQSVTGLITIYEVCCLPRPQTRARKSLCNLRTLKSPLPPLNATIEGSSLLFLERKYFHWILTGIIYENENHLMRCRHIHEIWVHCSRSRAPLLASFLADEKVM
jgi:hypothetical protein